MKKKPAVKKPNSKAEEKQKGEAFFKKHWKGMPEFNQPDAGPVKSILVHFATKEDMLKFSKLVNQEITAKLQYIWFPTRDREQLLDKRWSDKKAKK